MKKLALVIACIVGCVTPSRLDADVLAGLTPRPGKRTTTFALIIGVNRSVNKKHPTLEFADDDALRFYGYFKEIGDKTYLLTRPDADSLKLHQGSKVTWAPTLEKLREKVTAIKRDIENRLDKQSPVELFIVFTGHGDVDSKGRGYLALEDAVAAIEFMLVRPEAVGDIYNVVTLNATLDQVIDAVRSYVPTVEIEYTTTRLLNQVSYHVDDSKIRELGFSYRGNLAVGVRETFDLLRGVTLKSQ